ncbi:hypothetical protein ACFWPH_26510 [Nocardia sp. NPDC058499]|uniref:hypothetical protein n=1 Tax=Nocardia sp. NPDC058499 TaxID=3346530 RepID=UPI0036538C11
MPEYDAVRRQLSRYERGLYFELGRARERGETAEKGWVRQFTLVTGKGARVLDSARSDGRGTQGVERKSGRINEREALRQLERERSGLSSGQLTHSRWETVAGEKIPATVRDEMLAMARDFPGRFHHEMVSRADALRAIRIGQSLVSKQLELVRVDELERADRARKRLERIREIAREREAEQRSRDQAVAWQRQREAAQRVAESARQAREAARNGKHLPMTGREAADLLIVSRPTPGIATPHRQPPSPERAGRGRDGRGRDRGIQRER